MSDQETDFNAALAEAVGIDGATATEMQDILSGAAAGMINLFCQHMAREHRYAPASTVSALTQMAMISLINLSDHRTAVGWLRAVCDIYEREASGKPALPAQMEHLHRRSVALTHAGRRTAAARGNPQ